jgi:replicative DNA helicase
MADLLPPHSAETEEAVLGSMLIDPDAILRVASFLAPEHFYVIKNGWMYEAMLRLHDRREPIDLLTVSSELARLSKLDEVGGETYIAQLTNTVPTALNIESYARTVEALALRRRMIQAAGDIAKIAYDQTLPIEHVVEKSEATVFNVSQGRGEGHMVPMRKAVSDFFERIEYLHEHRGEPIGIPTGFSELDKLTGGLQKGDLIIIAARPGVGKTSLMNGIGYHAALKHRQRVALFSLEMSVEQLVQRFVAGETGIDSQRLRIADLRDEEWGALTRVSMQMADLLMFLDDTPSLSPLDLRVKARRIYQEYGLDLIIVDYLQLMSGETGMRNDNRVQEISYISRSLKGIARELKVPVIAGSQLSRLVEQRSDKRPMLSDLRESGCLVGDTLITMADTGKRVPIRDLASKSDFQVIALDPETLQLIPASVSRAFSTGVKQVYRLTTRLGRSVSATANHKFLTITGWRRLDELKPGIRIALPRVICPQKSRTMTDAELALMTIFKQNLSRERAMRVARVAECIELEKLAQSAIYWDEIVCIESLGEQEVFDLTVPGPHNFVADDIIVHNSIEQDSDIVMFIYRDELYNPDTEYKNIAEISVAKNRNGPTGKASLFFDKRLTSFKNLARERIEL